MVVQGTHHAVGVCMVVHGMLSGVCGHTGTCAMLSVCAWLYEDTCPAIRVCMVIQGTCGTLLGVHGPMGTLTMLSRCAWTYVTCCWVHMVIQGRVPCSWGMAIWGHSCIASMLHCQGVPDH